MRSLDPANDEEEHTKLCETQIQFTEIEANRDLIRNLEQVSKRMKKRYTVNS